MFIKIPFESEIDFKSNIREITKMSLEHDYNVNDGVILGNFYISGEYKTHELSINTEEFKYTLPFTVELRSDIDRESLDFNIEDFSYDIVDNTKLKINIEYSLAGDITTLDDDDVFERIDEDEMESDLKYMDDIINNEEQTIEEEEKIDEVISEEEEKEEERKDDIEVVQDEKEEKNEEVKENDVTEEIINERLNKEEEKTIMEKVELEEDTFVTYHIHIVKESDTFESISTLYKVPVSLINEYNSLETLNVGDKVLIPLADE